MEILENYDLTALNTLGVSARAKYFVTLSDEAELPELFNSDHFINNQKLFLGGGSNVLFTKDFAGIVIFNKLKGIEILKQDAEGVHVRAMGGESWHDLVTFAVERGYWGIENLSLIPGTVGAAPMQNIGAYGAEIKDVLENVEAYSTDAGFKKVFEKEECVFGYRDSVFKNKLKNKYFISAITLKLSKTSNPNLSYKILKEFFEKPARTTEAVQSGGNKIEVKSPKDISEAVVAIRKSKLPDPAIIGNAGSFFKNVFLEKSAAEEFLTKYPDAPHFEEDGVTKIPAAWLIEKCGPTDGASWKGYRVGNAGVHERQALVLVNHGNATGKEVVDLANKIIGSVKEKFGLTLTPEVNLI